MAVTTYYSLAGQLIGEQTTGGPQIAYIPDALGSVVAAIDENLNTVFTASYTPFGQTIASTGTAPRVTWCGTLGYLSSAGQTHCEHHVSTRFYSDSAGSWTSVDKLWPRQPAYGYVRGNPTTCTDPSGMAGTGVGTGGPTGPSMIIADFIRVFTSKEGQGRRFTRIDGTVSIPNQLYLMADPDAWAAFYLGAGSELEGGVSVQGSKAGTCTWRAFLNRATAPGQKPDEDRTVVTGVTCGSVVPVSLKFNRTVLQLGGLAIPFHISSLWVRQAAHPLIRRPVANTRAKMAFSTMWPYGAGAVPTSHSVARWLARSMMLFLPGPPIPRPWNLAIEPLTTPPDQEQIWYNAALATALSNLMGTPQIPAYTPIGALIANGDLAQGQMTTLAGSVNSVPFEPSYLGDLNLYNYDGAITHTVQVEFDAQVINLIQTSAPMSPGQETILNLRTVKSLTAPRIARTVTVSAENVAEIRALGSTDLDTVKTQADRKLINAVRDMRTTFEYHRVGGAMGILLDADGTTVLENYFTLLGVTQPTYNVAFGTAATQKFIDIAADLLNELEDALGNLSPAGSPPIVLCGRTFWKRFISSADVVTAYQYFSDPRFQKSDPLRQDIRYGDFEFGGIIWRQYRGQAANGPGRFVPDTEAQLLVPDIPGTYLGLFCPPIDQVSKVNTKGQPIYPTVKVLDHDAGYEIRLQSNPLHIMTRPAAAIQLYSSN